MMTLPIRQQIILFIFIPIVTIYSFIMAFNIFKMRQWTTINVEKRMTALAESYAYRFDSKLKEVAQVALMTAAYLESNPRLTSEQIDALLRLNLRHNLLVYGSAVAFEPYKYIPDRRLFVRYAYRDGDTLRHADPTETGYDYTALKQEYWHEPKKTKKAIWTDPYYDEGAGNILMCTYSVPFFETEEFLGIATIDIPLEPLRQKVKIGIPEDIKFSVITETGKYVYSPHLERINKSIHEIWSQPDSKDILELSKIIASGKTGFAKIHNWESEELEWIFYTPVKSARWGFVASLSEKRAIAALKEQLYRDIVFLIISLILIAASLWFLSIRISRPITLLKDAVTEIADGNLNARAEMERNDEIGILAGRFNEMAQKLSRREEALQESEKRYKNLIEDAVIGIYQVTQVGQFLMINQRMAEIFGYGSSREFLASIDNVIELYAHPEERPEILQEIDSKGFVKGREVEFKRKGGKSIWIKLNTRVTTNKDGGTFYEGLMEDISEQKRLETQLQQAQKMEAIGTLAGGIAHDFNNILQSIILNTEMALYEYSAGTLDPHKMEEVLKGSKRAADLVKQILTFSRQSEREIYPLSIVTVVKEALKMLRSSLPTTIEIKQHIETTTDMVLADPTQIHQVMMNLGTNAAHAMRQKGGVLEVSLRSDYLDSEAAAHYQNLDPGDYQRLTVSDTGQGMTADVIERIFDPFFTTKAPGEGTGMGLAVVHGIIKSLGGDIRVNSMPEKGTTFEALLPLEKGTFTPKRQLISPLPKGNERILIVDDEKTTVDAIEVMLENLGYTVMAQTTSIETLNAFRSQPDKFDLIITDMTMPKMTGADLAYAVMKIRPDIPIILCTGFSELIDEDKAKAMGIRAFVMKPIVMGDLAKIIREVLDNEET